MGRYFGVWKKLKVLGRSLEAKGIQGCFDWPCFRISVSLPLAGYEFWKGTECHSDLKAKSTVGQFEFFPFGHYWYLYITVSIDPIDPLPMTFPVIYSRSCSKTPPNARSMSLQFVVKVKVSLKAIQ